MRHQKTPSQDDFQRISKYVVEPMVKMYDKKINDYFRDMLIEDLMWYSNDVLQEAMILLRQNCEHCPRTSSKIIECCEKAKKELQFDSSTQETEQSAHEFIKNYQEQNDRARKLAHEYVDYYMNTSETAKAAREGNYEPPLRRYVMASAWFQSQCINSIKNKAIDWHVLFDRHIEITEEDKKQLIGDLKRQAQTGNIEVAVPIGHLLKWKKYATPTKKFIPDPIPSGQLADPSVSKPIAQALETLQF